MASQSNPPYWTWSVERNDHYHDEWHSQTRRWLRTWAKDRVPRTSHVPSTNGVVSSGSAVYSSSMAARPPSTNQQAVDLVDEFARLNTHDYSRTSSSAQNLNYPHQPSMAEASGHRRNIESQSSHNLIPATRGGGQYASTQSYPPGGIYGPGQGGNVHGSAYSGHARGELPAQGYEYDSASLSRASGAFDSRAGGISQSTQLPDQPNFNIPAHSNLNLDDFKQMIPSRNFFIVGKVFVMFYIENAGPNLAPPNDNNSNFTSVPHGEWAHHQFRRFVVVKNVQDQFFSYCCPITTYSGQATTKTGVNQNTHTIVYSESTPPKKLPGETQMNKDPLRIVVESPRYKLDTKSRINLSKMMSIDHNVRVKSIGTVHPQSLAKLIVYVKSIQSN